MKDTVQELLKPRYKVIADYPDSSFKIGHIINCIDDFNKGIEFYKGYPHLFKPLAWYEEREASEMPEYVKDKTAIPIIIRKVKNHFTMHYPNHHPETLEDISMFISDDDRTFPYWAHYPSTESEYLNNLK